MMSDYPERVLAGVLNCCKRTIEEGQDLQNMAAFCREGEELLTLFYRYPISPLGDPDAMKEPITLLLGEVGAVINADLIVVVQDTWYVRVDTKSDFDVTTMGDFTSEEAIGVRPSQHPDRTEALCVAGFRSDGTTLPGALLPYTRDAENLPVWGEFDELDKEGLWGGKVCAAFRAGFAAPRRRSLAPVLRLLQRTMDGPVSMMVFDEDLSKQLRTMPGSKVVE